ncbi:MAG: tetratricopeptide repeat protein [Ardenticatenaceae bacterium]|nr:tetratricopeptide repeat protein [Ardenticatenaceae bacterium]
MCLGEAAEAERAWEAARRAYETALLALETLPPDQAGLRQRLDLRLRCDALYDLAAARGAQAENLRPAFRLAEALADPAAQSEVRARQCWLAQRQGRLQDALILGHQALALAGREGRLRAQGIRLLGITNELLGHYPTALRFHQEALALDAACPERLRLDHINLASVCGSLGRDWQAREHAWAALALIPDRPPSLVRALALGNLAGSERELGDFKAAAQHVRGAQAVAAARGRSRPGWPVAPQPSTAGWATRAMPTSGPRAPGGSVTTLAIHAL